MCIYIEFDNPKSPKQLFSRSKCSSAIRQDAVPVMIFFGPLPIDWLQGNQLRLRLKISKVPQASIACLAVFVDNYFASAVVLMSKRSEARSLTLELKQLDYLCQVPSKSAQFNKSGGGVVLSQHQFCNLPFD